MTFFKFLCFSLLMVVQNFSHTKTEPASPGKFIIPFYQGNWKVTSFNDCLYIRLSQGLITAGANCTEKKFYTSCLESRL